MEDELIDIEAEFDRFFSEAPMEANNPFTSSPEQPAMRLMKPVPPGPCKLKATLQPAMRLMKPEPPAPCKLKGTPRSRLPFRRTCSRQLSFFDNAAQESGQLGSDFQGTPDLQLVTLRFGCTRGVCRGGLQPARSQAQDPLRSAAGEPRGRHPVQADSEAEGAGSAVPQVTCLLHEPTCTTHNHHRQRPKQHVTSQIAVPQPYGHPVW